MEVRVESHGDHVVIVTIDNQPRRNAMTRAMMAELATLWEEMTVVRRSAPAGTQW